MNKKRNWVLLVLAIIVWVLLAISVKGVELGPDGETPVIEKRSVMTATVTATVGAFDSPLATPVPEQTGEPDVFGGPFVTGEVPAATATLVPTDTPAPPDGRRVSE